MALEDPLAKAEKALGQAQINVEDAKKELDEATYDLADNSTAIDTAPIAGGGLRPTDVDEYLDDAEKRQYAELCVKHKQLAEKVQRGKKKAKETKEGNGNTGNTEQGNNATNADKEGDEEMGGQTQTQTQQQQASDPPNASPPNAAQEQGTQNGSSTDNMEVDIATRRRALAERAETEAKRIRGQTTKGTQQG